METQESLRIGLLGSFDERIPPWLYGGTERFLAWLANNLVAQGHDVTLFGSGDSDTLARLMPCTDQAVRTMPEAQDLETRRAISIMGLEKAISYIGKHQEEFDIIHANFSGVAPDYLPLLMRDAAGIKVSFATTFHGPLSAPNQKYMYTHRFPNEPVVSISNDQRRPLPNLNYIDTVYHGIDLDEFTFSPNPGQYLGFMACFSPDKGGAEAIEVAKKAGVPLIMAGKVDAVDRDHFEAEIKPHIDGRNVKYIGEVGGKAKDEFLGGALAILAPLKRRWKEPFGLAYVETMATGTPVISRPWGSLPEVVGNTGFLCRELNDMVTHITSGDVLRSNRAANRKHVETYFTADQMARNYVNNVYRKVIQYV
ncbi:MAG TPA: glycosyltransferase family 4 protein [Candidatus Saccharimonadales bacterium]|nr:glycosyltransferase family 4 protein [Candidatus Saccharimonadales bacterium]